jgi:DNA-binding NarL/FixJ family response regulator
MVYEKGRCVVLADKHPNVLEGVRGLLETMFNTVVMVADRQSLFEAIEKVKPDMVVTDLSLPPVTGESIIREISDNCPGLKYIILSTQDDPTVVDEVMSAGASGFVLKQFVAVDLFEAILCVQEGRTFVSHPAKQS